MQLLIRVGGQSRLRSRRGWETSDTVSLLCDFMHSLQPSAAKLVFLPTAVVYQMAPARTVTPHSNSTWKYVGLFDSLNLYASVGITMVKVVLLPLVGWFLLGRPRSWWTYVSVISLGVITLLFNEVGDVLIAWWNEGDSDSFGVASTSLDTNLLVALQVRAEGVGLAVAGACAVFFLGSE